MASNVRSLEEIPHLAGMLPEDLVRHMTSLGVRLEPPQARRILARAFAPPGRLRRPPSVPRALLDAVDRATSSAPLEVVDRATDPADGFVKYLFRSPDGALSEAVRIPLHKPGRYTVCLSSQVGCAMGCVFCATGRLGLTRNLEAWEIVQAFLQVRAETDGVVTGAVFQGQGEPLHNYERVIQAARVLSDPSCGAVSARAITISTVGLVPQIRRFAREGHPYRLIVSLTSAVAEKREALLPVAGRFPLDDLAAAIRELAASPRSQDRVTVAWVLLSGVNTGADEALALRDLLAGVPLRVNLIDVNDPRPPEEHPFLRASDAERAAFVDALQVLRAPVVRRYSGGAARHAACGMLAASRQAGDQTS